MNKSIVFDYISQMNKMKRLTILLLVFWTVTICVSAQNKKFDKLINEFDVIEYVEHLEKNRPDLFWGAVWRNNEKLNKLYDAITKKKSTALDAQKDLYEAALFSAEHYNNLPLDTEFQYIADTLLNIVGIKAVFPDTKAYVIYDDRLNACSCPDGRIYLNSGLVMYDSISIKGLLGICAHETAHFLLQHSLEGAYAFRKKEKKNKIIAGVVSAVDAAANAYAQANGAVGDESWDNVNERIESNIIWAGNNSLKYRYKYSREQEIEADIIAYRFLEYMGLGGEHYINALKAIGYESDAYYDDTSDHPTTEFRVELLEYLSNKNVPNLQN